MIDPGTAMLATTALGIGGSLLGGDGGSQKMKVENRPWNQQTRTGMINAADMANQLLQQPMEFFPGQTYAGFDPRQLSGLGGMEEYLGAQAPGMVGGAQNAWQGALNAPDVGNNPYVNNMIEAQGGLLNRNLTENLLPAISGGAMAAGQTGGSRQGIAEGLALRGTQDALANSAAQTQLGAYNQGLGTQQAALAQANNMLGLGMYPGQQMYGIGDIYRGMDQAGIDEAIARHEYEQEEPWERVNSAIGVYGGTGGTGGSQATTAPGVPLTDKLLGTATTLGSAWLGAGMPGWGNQSTPQGSVFGQLPYGGAASGVNDIATQNFLPIYNDPMMYA